MKRFNLSLCFSVFGLIFLTSGCSARPFNEGGAGGNGTTFPPPQPPEEKITTFKAGAYNVLYSYSSSSYDQNHWNYRSLALVQSFLENKFDIVAVIEADWRKEFNGTPLPEARQLPALLKASGMNYRWCDAENYDTAIAWNPTRFDVFDSGYFLCYDQDTSHRVTYAKVKDLNTGKFFLFMAHHGDSRDTAVNLKGIQLINRKEPELNLEGWPAFVCGDMNASPGSRNMDEFLTHWKDSYTEAEKRVGPVATGHGLNVETANMTLEKNRIDYILFRGEVKILNYTCDGKSFPVRYNGANKNIFPSDHSPISVIVELE